MKPSVLVVLVFLVPGLLHAASPNSPSAAAPAADLAREVSLTREMVEDAAIRFDDEGLRLARERAARLAATAEAAGEVRAARDAHYLIALAVWGQLYTGHNEVETLRRLTEEGVRHADRATVLDADFADGFAMGGANRAGAFLYGGGTPEVRAAMIERLQKAAKIDASSTPAAFFRALSQSIDPKGPARPEGVQAYGDLVKRLEARHAGGEPIRPGLWDVEAGAWYAIVRLQQDRPDAAAIRPDVARLVAMRPDSALAREQAARLEHRSWAPAAAVAGLTWSQLGSDAAGDGKETAAPDVRTLELARGADRVWFRLGFDKELPSSFGINLAIDRDGDPAGGDEWWGGGSRFRYDRLVTAWVVREGDGFFGTVGVTDATGGNTQRLMKLSTDVLLRLGEDGKSVMAGVPAPALELAAGAKVVGAGGTNLMWNDNLTAAGDGGIDIPAK